MIQIQVNSSGVLMMLAQATGQLEFAMATALNRVANDGQKAEQGHLKRAFTLRRETFVMRGIKIEKLDRATKSSWRVVISVPVTQDFLTKFEQGDPKVPRMGKWLWIPNSDVFKNKIISRGNPLHPKSLQFSRSKGGQLQGRERTFMLKSKAGHPIVLQRQDRGLAKGSRSTMRSMTLDNVNTNQGAYSLKKREQAKSISRGGGTGARLLYTLVSRVKTPVRLEFVSTISQEVQRMWPARAEEAVLQALRTAR